MTDQSCIFCKIISRQLASVFIKETDDLIVIADLYPKAPVHYLIIPKIHVSDIQHLAETDEKLAGSMIMMARSLSKELFNGQAFKLVINSGAAAGQHIFHLHMHFLSGGPIDSV
jgi:histidine triad (HIT) family protein